MKPSLQLRLSQHLALTPQLQQSIRLLQLSTLELNQELDQALADNPLLERDDDPQALAMRVKPDGSIAVDVPVATPELLNGHDAPAPTDAGDRQDGPLDGNSLTNGVVPAMPPMRTTAARLTGPAPRCHCASICGRRSRARHRREIVRWSNFWSKHLMTTATCIQHSMNCTRCARLKQPSNRRNC